jgi:hypothetical protein
LDLLADAAATRQPLAQLHLQQGPNIDQWRSSALGGLDAATHLDMVRQSLVDTHQALTGLTDRPAWRVRRASTLTTIVDETIVRITELAQQPYDAPAIVAIYHALQRMAPEAFAQQRGAFLLGVRSVAERIINSAGKELAAIEQAFAAFEHILPEMHVGFEQDAEHALRQGLVSALWYRLVDVHDALSVWNIQSWTSRSYTVCRMRACPQLAALVWLRTLLSLPTIQVEQCVVLTQQLREAWATPRPGPQTPAPMQSLVDPGHLPADLDFEPIARAQLSTWIAVLPEQLPSLAPFEADPIREVFAQLADALQMQIDVEMGLPITDGDAEMQARELAEFIQEWEQEHDRPFPGYEALFSSDDAWFAGGRFTQQPLNDFVLYDDDSP